MVGAEPCDGIEYLTFEVNDTGEGISAGRLNSIFLSEHDNIELKKHTI